MATIEFTAGEYQLEQINLYPAPNPAITEFLLGDRLHGVVAEYTARVGTNYVQRLADRPHKGDTHAGHMESAVNAEVFVGGYRHDRWTGEIRVETEYALADEYGRHAYNPYAGSHDLRDALFNVLEQRL